MAQNRTMQEKNRRVKQWAVQDNRDRQGRDIISERFDPRFFAYGYKPYSITSRTAKKSAGAVYRSRPIVHPVTEFAQGELQYV